jgi:transposase-like protein
MKSNQGIAEELQRLSRYLAPQEPCCPDPACVQHGVPISRKGAYVRYGKTKSGCTRMRCQVCRKIFSLTDKPTPRQRSAHKNRQILTLLLNKMPFARICEACDITMSTLYGKIDFFHRQALAFVAAREQRLHQGFKKNRLYLATDRQDYVVNWTCRADKRNVTLSAVATADLQSGYVFGMHPNYDAGLDRNAVEAAAKQLGDPQTPSAFRRYARLWLESDYQRSVNDTLNRRQARGGQNDPAAVYADSAARQDPESSEEYDQGRKLPDQGMQVHSEYTLYAHFLLLRQLFRGVGKVRFYMDQESGIRAACLAAFQDRVRSREVDAFYVRINKEATVTERRALVAQARHRFQNARQAHPHLTEFEVQQLLMQQEIARASAIGKWKDRWLVHPLPSKAEPQKAVCYLTDFRDYAPDHLASLYLKASLHAVDRFFMLIRRRLSLLERPVATPSASGRTWYGYAAYNPATIVKLLEIFRVAYNYVWAGQDGKTPAMRLGLAKAPIALEDLLYFDAHTEPPRQRRKADRSGGGRTVPVRRRSELLRDPKPMEDEAVPWG